MSVASDRTASVAAHKTASIAYASVPPLSVGSLSVAPMSVASFPSLGPNDQIIQEMMDLDVKEDAAAGAPEAAAGLNVTQGGNSSGSAGPGRAASPTTGQIRDYDQDNNNDAAAGAPEAAGFNVTQGDNSNSIVDETLQPDVDGPPAIIEVPVYDPPIGDPGVQIFGLIDEMNVALNSQNFLRFEQIRVQLENIDTQLLQAEVDRATAAGDLLLTHVRRQQMYALQIERLRRVGRASMAQNVTTNINEDAQPVLLGEAAIPPGRNIDQMTDKDVMLGQGGRKQKSDANEEFRDILLSYGEAYRGLPRGSKLKTSLFTTIREELEEKGFRFWRQDRATKLWYEETDVKKIHEKIAQFMRDAFPVHITEN